MPIRGRDEGQTSTSLHPARFLPHEYLIEGLAREKSVRYPAPPLGRFVATGYAETGLARMKSKPVAAQAVLFRADIQTRAERGRKRAKGRWLIGLNRKRFDRCFRIKTVVTP